MAPAIPWFACRPRLVSTARLTFKGQVTIPKTVRDALDLHEGDELVFRLERTRAVLAKTPDFIELAGRPISWAFVSIVA
jgi:AbrB family looped-hinge helix DNA binding protein